MAKEGAVELGTWAVLTRRIAPEARAGRRPDERRVLGEITPILQTHA